MTKDAGLVRIPKRFFVDHIERDLPSPEIVKETRSHYFISRDDENLDELISDAEHYADKHATDCEAWLRTAAAALLAALEGAGCSSIKPASMSP
jgi:hypothetical protein